MTGRKAFTLIELLVVISIICVLMAAVRPMLTASTSKAREFECESNLKQIGMAMHAYSQDYGALPEKLDGVDCILQDKNLLSCPKTGHEYCYFKPAPNTSADAVIASCIDPHKVHSGFPHRYGSCYLTLTAGGRVAKISVR